MYLFMPYIYTVFIDKIAYFLFNLDYINLIYLFIHHIMWHCFYMYSVGFILSSDKCIYSQLNVNFTVFIHHNTYPTCIFCIYELI